MAFILKTDMKVSYCPSNRYRKISQVFLKATVSDFYKTIRHNFPFLAGITELGLDDTDETFIYSNCDQKFAAVVG